MDVIAALHWLQENIGAFGGDPQSVTLAGHGTGAACVHFLISSSAVPEGMCCSPSNIYKHDFYTHVAHIFLDGFVLYPFTEDKETLRDATHKYTRT